MSKRLEKDGNATFDVNANMEKKLVVETKVLVSDSKWTVTRHFSEDEICIESILTAVVGSTIESVITEMEINGPVIENKEVA